MSPIVDSIAFHIRSWATFSAQIFPELRIRRNVLRRQFSASKDLHEVTKRECTQKSIAAGSDFKVHAVAVTQESDPVC